MDGDAVDKPKYEELERELHECRAILHAIRSGKVDTVFGEGTRGPAVYTIRNAEIEQENARLIARLEESSRRKSDLLAGISHELRSPLAAAGEFVDLVGESPDLPLKLKRPLMLARRNIARLTRLIDDLLSLSRLEAGQPIVIHPQPVSPDDLVREAMHTIGPFAEAKKVRIVTDANRAGAVFGDLYRLTQVLVNLLLNAVRFSPAGQAVRLSAVDDGGGFIRFEVNDAGPGVPLQEQSRIFERYYQVSPDDQPGRGAGLGLAVARDIIDAHRGQIGVLGSPEEGATFHFTVPLCNNMEQRAMVVLESALREAAGPVAVILAAVPAGRLDSTLASAALDAVLRSAAPAAEDLVMLGGARGMLVLHLDRAEAMRLGRRLEARLSEAIGPEESVELNLIALPGDVDTGVDLIARLERRLGLPHREVQVG